MDLDIATHGSGDAVIVVLSGELDIASAPTLDECLTGFVEAGRIRLVLDLTQLVFCDSTGLSTFVKANHGCVEQGGYLRLAGPNDHVARVLSIVGLLDLFPTYRTVEGALHSDSSALVTPITTP